jgi:phosphatidylglycerophosphatase C
MVLAMDHASDQNDTGKCLQENETLIAMQQPIAFFDFDGTITEKDTLLEFIRFSKGNAYFRLGFLLNSPWLMAYKLRLVSNQRAKERILTFFFGRCPVHTFTAHCDRFSAEILPGLIRARALEEIKRLQAAGVSIVIVSASPENWIRSWSMSQQADVLATRLEVSGDRMTGKIEGANCHGEEKVRRIEAAYQLKEYSKIYAYGDTKGDLPMLALADIRFYKPFR